MPKPAGSGDVVNGECGVGQKANGAIELFASQNRTERFAEDLSYHSAQVRPALLYELRHLRNACYRMVPEAVVQILFKRALESFSRVACVASSRQSRIASKVHEFSRR